MLYFDHNATTPVAPEVAEVFSRAIRELPGNASSMHRSGQIARQQLESARAAISRNIAAAANELVFTSGGTEANNLAIFGLVRGAKTTIGHAITSTIEHPSVLECFLQLEREGFQVTYVPTSKNGIVSPEQVAAFLRPETILVSIMHANNETGAVQPVREIAEIIRQRRSTGQPLFFHSDGVQALGKMAVHMGELGADLYSMSAHKVYGPKGVGTLFARKGTPLSGIQLGGRHERARRAGTENVAGALAFARALEIASPELSVLRDQFEAALISALDGIEINCGAGARLPNTSNVLFHGVSGEALLIALDQAGMAVSTGAACSSGSLEPSPVLLAMGRNALEARSSVRFSFGRANTPEEVDALIAAVIASVKRLRANRLRKAQLAV